MTPYQIPPNGPGGQPSYSCRPLNAGEGDYSQPTVQYYVPPLYAAYATTEDHEFVAWASNYASSSEAQEAAVTSCSSEVGGQCEAMDWFSEQCGAWARGNYGGLFAGYDTSYRTAARKAIENCNENDPGGKCRLMVMPVCTGSRYSAGLTRRLKNASAKDIEDLSARYDRREYWGVLAAGSDNVVSWGADYPSRSVALEDVYSICEGTCRELATFRDSCGSAAWDTHTRQALSVATDDDPVAAQEKALRLCAQNGGQDCGSFVRCSGRAYIDGYEGMDS